MTVRDLTPAEVAALPLELRCCWFYMPWNTSLSPRDIDEWAEQIGWYAFQHDVETQQEQNPVEAAKNEAGRLLAFVSQLLSEERARSPELAIEHPR